MCFTKANCNLVYKIFYFFFFKKKKKMKRSINFEKVFFKQTDLSVKFKIFRIIIILFIYSTTLTKLKIQLLDMNRQNFLI